MKLTAEQLGYKSDCDGRAGHMNIAIRLVKGRVKNKAWWIVEFGLHRAAMQEPHEGPWAGSTYKKMYHDMLILTSHGHEAFINKTKKKSRSWIMDIQNESCLVTICNSDKQSL